MRVSASIALGLLATAPLAAKPIARSGIPLIFRGDWVAAGRECAPGPSDNGNLRITANRIYSFESLTKVRRVVVTGDSSITVEGRTTHGGGSFASPWYLMLSGDRRHLHIGQADADDYVRCTT
jgi:hypothetical protein